MTISKPNHQVRIGAFVLETLTTGMYRNPLDALREYVQNAFDSIRNAERDGSIMRGAGRIHLTISEKDRSLTLRDNGTGVGASEVVARLVNVGMSSKNLETDAGFRGIGRLAGIAYCEQLIFKTQKNGEQDVSTVIFDAVALKEAMSPKNRVVEELANVIEKYVSVINEKTRKQDHFFEVTMRSINSGGALFLSSNDVRTYLEQVAPLKLDTQSFPFSKDFYDWVEKTGVALPEVSLVVNNNGSSYELYKPYKKITYTTAQTKEKIHVRALNFFPEGVSGGSPFWGWYAETNCPGVIGDSSVAGIRLRKSNISIGLSERMAEVFRSVSNSYERLNGWFMGEIHIQDPSIIPNAHRDDFEDTPEWVAIKEQLINFAKERCKEARDKSEGRNADVNKIISTAEKHIDEAIKKQKTGLATKDEQEKLCDKIKKHIAKINLAEKSERSEEELRRLESVKKRLEAANEQVLKTDFTAQGLKSSLDKKQRNIVKEIIGILYEVLDNSTFEKARDAILKKYQKD